MARETERRRGKVTSARERAQKHEAGFGSTTVSIPEGMPLFKLKEAKAKTITIVPFTAGKGNPFADPGALHYERTYYAHRTEADGNSHVCLNRTCGKPCPICEERSKAERNGDKELAESLKSKERQLFLVIDHDERDKGLQLWDVSYHLFGKALDKQIKLGDEDDGWDTFHDPDNGFDLKISVEEKSMGAKSKPFFAVEAVMFKERKKPIPEELLDEAPCLDDLLKIESYKTLKALMEGADDADEEDDDEDEDERPAKKSKPASKKSKDEDEEDVSYEDDEDEAPKSKKKSKKVVDEDDEDDEDEDEDEAPAPKKKAKKPSDDEDEDEDWGEDEEEAPKPKKKSR